MYQILAKAVVCGTPITGLLMSITYFIAVMMATLSAHQLASYVQVTSHIQLTIQPESLQALCLRQIQKKKSYSNYITCQV